MHDRVAYGLRDKALGDPIHDTDLRNMGRRLTKNKKWVDESCGALMVQNISYNPSCFAVKQNYSRETPFRDT